jgi:hypothetical protein
MKTEHVCFPPPVDACFLLPASTPAESSDDGDFGEEEMLVSDELIRMLRAQAPEGCFLCLTDAWEEED